MTHEELEQQSEAHRRKWFETANALYRTTSLMERNDRWRKYAEFAAGVLAGALVLALGVAAMFL